MDKILDLSNVTYFSIVGNESKSKYTDIDSIVKIGIHSSKNIKFGEKIIYTYKKPTVDTQDFKIVLIPEIKYDYFSEFVLLNYSKLFNTEYMINFHHDGFIQNPSSWDNSFFDYDYIGAPMHNFGFLLNGNGGFSLRSKKMMDVVSELYKQNNLLKNIPEDVVISIFLKDILNNIDIKFAPLEKCVKFSLEHHLVFNETKFEESFGFHEIEKLFNEEEKNRRRNLYLNIF